MDSKIVSHLKYFDNSLNTFSYFYQNRIDKIVRFVEFERLQLLLWQNHNCDESRGLILFRVPESRCLFRNFWENCLWPMRRQVCLACWSNISCLTCWRVHLLDLLGIRLNQEIVDVHIHGWLVVESPVVY